MQARAAQPYQRENRCQQSVLERIDYDEHGKIKFKTELIALFKAQARANTPVTFFHLGRVFREPVHMYVLSGATGSTSAREILYDPAYFTMPADSPGARAAQRRRLRRLSLQESRLGDQQALDWQQQRLGGLPRRLLFPRHRRARQYGLSARGIALDVAQCPTSPRSFRISRASTSSRRSGRARTTVTRLRAARGPERRRRLPVPDAARTRA